MEGEHSEWQTLYQDATMRLRMVASDGNIVFKNEQRIGQTRFNVYTVSIFVLNVPTKGVSLRPVAFIIPVVKKTMDDLSKQLNKKYLKNVEITETGKTVTFKFLLWERKNADSDKEKRLAKVLAFLDKFKEVFKVNMQDALAQARNIQEREL